MTFMTSLVPKHSLPHRFFNCQCGLGLLATLSMKILLVVWPSTQMPISIKIRGMQNFGGTTN